MRVSPWIRRTTAMRCPRRWSSRLHDGLTRASADQGVRVVSLGHTGGTFCAGADLSEGKVGGPRSRRCGCRPGAGTDPSATPDSGVARCRSSPRSTGMFGQAGWAWSVRATSPSPGSSSTFALTEARIGVAPSIISLTLLPKMTARAAGRYFVTGEKFGADDAAAIGTDHRRRRRRRRRPSPS